MTYAFEVESLREGYYWPTLFNDAHAHVGKCQICQVNTGREGRSAFPLHPITIENPFEQWVLDVVGEINLNSSKLHKYIFPNGLNQSHVRLLTTLR